MRIEDATQTVGGYPVRIYAIDGGLNRNSIHGAFWRIDGWMYQVWRYDGKAQLPEQNSCFHLDLYDWRDEIPWSCLHDEIEWVIWDKRCGWCGVLNWTGGGADPTPKPQSDSRPIWFTWALTYSLEGVKMPKPPANWREAIAQRPKEL